MTNSSRLPKHSWTKEEKAGLVKLVNAGGWRSDNGTFCPGYLNQLARMMAFKIPGCNIHASTIDGRIKLMKRMFHALAEMRGPTVIRRRRASLISHFPHYDELSYVFGKDRATGGRAKSFVDVGSNDPAGYDAFVADAAPDMDFPPMYSQGLNMSPDDLMGIRTARVSEGSTAIEYGNEQLNRIAEWPVLQRQDASQTRQKVVRQLEAIPELTLMYRCRLMRVLMRNVNDMKVFLDVPDNMKYPYCSIILQEN
ncbi:retrotransposon protein [Cucumis melo var. makuwa]|uniref:Retrotransposon protein n=1 Tax=Cucumis melo var. makuwa TaxID=1194695 RepID=A0A5D3BPL3_CUCMM|nr:retrotransposon protein [Cucumis melo var. makuwa]TYK00702.1 retrotransposon protein [Cucumis melo var. makuwa]